MMKIINCLLFVLKNWYTWWVQLLTVIGNIKVYKTPCFVLYSADEYDYKIRGYEIRNACELLIPGDIILRGYEHYLDGMLIPGNFSHAGVYIGNNTIIHAIAEGVTEIDVIDYMQCDRIAILRPKEGAENAIEFVKNAVGSEYDFKFRNSDSSEFYCFELAAKAYKSLQIEPHIIDVFGFKLDFLTSKYIAESFIDSPDFTVIHTINKK